MLSVWIERFYIPKDELHLFPDDGDCVEIQINEICEFCNKKRMISAVYTGSKVEASAFAHTCEHVHTYRDVYKNRIKNVKSSSLYIYDALNDGAKCAGRCGNWVPLAAPNQSNGTFICYGCRSSF